MIDFAGGTWLRKMNNRKMNNRKMNNRRMNNRKDEQQKDEQQKDELFSHSRSPSRQLSRVKKLPGSLFFYEETSEF